MNEKLEFLLYACARGDGLHPEGVSLRKAKGRRALLRARPEDSGEAALIREDKGLQWFSVLVQKVCNFLGR